MCSNYRCEVLRRVPGLVWLDGTPITAAERAAAAELDDAHPTHQHYRPVGADTAAASTSHYDAGAAAAAGPSVCGVDAGAAGGAVGGGAGGGVSATTMAAVLSDMQALGHDSPLRDENDALRNRVRIDF